MDDRRRHSCDNSLAGLRYGEHLDQLPGPPQCIGRINRFVDREHLDCFGRRSEVGLAGGEGFQHELGAVKA